MSIRWIAAWALLALTVVTMPPRSSAQADPFEVAPNGSSKLGEFWQEQRGSGVWRSNYFSSSRTLNREKDFLGATLQLRAFPSVNERLDGKIEARLVNSNIGNDAPTRGHLLEGYLTLHFSRAYLRIGKQIVPWGRADGINPTDNLTPRQFTVLLPFEEDQRMGTTAAKLDVFISQVHTLTFFTTPYFEPSTVPLPPGGKVVNQEPTRTGSNSHSGIRLDKSGEGLDWSLSYFRGYSLLPGAQLIDVEMSEPTLLLRYDRITVFGADFARNFGRFGIRGEAAYVDTADDAGLSASVKNPFLHWIVGIDRTFGDNLNVNLQFFQRRVRHHRDPHSWPGSSARNTAVLNSLIDGQRDQVTNGISFRVSNKWLNNTLEAEIFAVGNLTRDDSFLRPLVTYAFNDRWKGTLGAELYRGATGTQYGVLEPNRSVFAELRYGF